MFNRTPKNESHPLDETIENHISELAGLTAGDEAHNNAVSSLKTLMELRTADKAARKPTVSPDMMASVAGHLVGISMILGFEKANVLTSKSLTFVQKIR
jgi:ATP phosphoribosyltransferase regulatory subunit HisZ